MQRKPKLQPYDAFLKKFEHKKALDAALQVRWWWFSCSVQSNGTHLVWLQSRHPVVVVSLLEELVQRDCLVSAIGGR